MEPEALDAITSAVAEGVTNSVQPLVNSVGQTLSDPSGWSFGSEQFDQLMSVLSSLLVTNVFLVVVACVLCGLVCGVLLTTHWRP